MIQFTASTTILMKNRKFVVIVLLMAAVMIGAGKYFYVNRNAGSGTGQPAPKELPKVKIGIQSSPAMALVMTAKEEGCFEQEGVEVELVPFTAGKFALQALLGGSLNYCVSGEVPVALATLQGNKISVLSQVVRETVNECRIVARKDETSGNGPGAYFKAKKRKLATSIGGGPEFFTHSFLEKFGIPATQVEIIAQKPEDMPAALASGSVDAIGIFDPLAFIAEKRLGSQAVTFADPSLYSELYILCVSEKKLAENDKTVDAVLRALVKAGMIIKADPQKAKAAVEKHTKLDRVTIDGIWNNFQFEAALTPQLLEFWNAQAEWAKNTGKLGADAKTPDFRSIIADGPLRRIRPEAVTIPAR
jgi:NitT/TauT family transport system substrate-binding protein